MTSWARGIGPWSGPPWESPLDCVGMTSWVRGIGPWSGPPWESPLDCVGMTSWVRGIDPWRGSPWESPLDPGGRGNRLYWVSGPQRRQIPRRRRTDTPPDLRFIRLPLWESPPESPDRGNRLWGDLPRVGLTSGAAPRPPALRQPVLATARPPPRDLFGFVTILKCWTATMCGAKAIDTRRMLCRNSAAGPRSLPIRSSGA